MKSGNRNLLLIAFGVLFTSVLFLKPVSAASLAARTQSQIQLRYEQLAYNMNQETAYEKEPAYSGKYSEGKIRGEDQDNALKVLNFIRYVAGVPDDVVLSDTCILQAQRAALLMEIGGELTHNPSRPKSMENDFYLEGWNGAQKSNLSRGVPTLTRSLLYYMSDTDSSNIASLGHRRWLLNPSMGVTGFGYLQADVRGNPSYASVYALDASRGGGFEYDYVAWPAAQTPYELIDQKDSSGYAFSVNLGAGYDQPILENLTVTVRQNGSEIASLSADNTSENLTHYLNVGKDGYGLGKCVIFDFGTVKNNAVYDIRIDGLTSEGEASPLSYSVHIFSLLGEHTHDTKGEGIVRTPVTCTTDGTAYQTCSGCTEYISRKANGDYPLKVLRAPGHQYKEVIIKQPTDSSSGLAEKVCVVCGDIASTVTIPATNPSVPAQVQKLRASTVGTTKIKLSWSAVSGAVGYKVYQAAAKAGPYVEIADGRGTSYTKSSLKARQTYYYKVRAYRTIDKEIILGSPSAVVTKKLIPDAPVLKAAAVSGKNMKVSWNSVAAVRGYEVFCSSSKKGVYSRIAVVKKGVLKKTFSGFTANNTYYVKLRAYFVINGSKVYGEFSAPYKVD